jgi:2-dehydro-3-deoxygluconokinase
MSKKSSNTMKHNPLFKISPSKSMKFVSVGECMVEMAPADNPATYQMSFAGDTYNTIWYLKKLRPDWSTQYLTRVGTDTVSGAMLDMMHEAGTGIDHITGEPTRTAGLYMVSLNQGERSFSYWRDTSAARLLAEDSGKLEAAFSEANVIYFSGISIAILEGKGRENLLDALRTARSNGKTIVFDPNLRPRLWTDTEEMKIFIMKCAEVSDIVLPSYDDEADHFGDADIFATRDRYLAAGSTTVVVKNGAGEMICTHLGETIHVSPPVAQNVVDTTAAGDSFNAGFFAGLEICETMEEALLMGANIAGQVISKRGALVSIDQSIR